MNAEFLVIDDLGDVWFTDMVRRRFSDVKKPFLPHVLSLGFVTLRVAADQRLVVRLNLGSVKLQAISGLLYLLSDLRPNRVALHIERHGYMTEIVNLDRGPWHAISAINSLLKEASAPPELRINCVRKEIDSLNPESRLGQALDFWRDRRGDLFGNPANENLKRVSSERFLLVERGDDGGFRIEAFGDNQPAYILGWLRQRPSQPLAAYPDTDYAFLSEVAYMRALRANRPILDEVAAVVNTSKGGEGTFVKRRYRRLLLPIVEKARDRVLSITEDMAVCY